MRKPLKELDALHQLSEERTANLTRLMQEVQTAKDGIGALVNENAALRQRVAVLEGERTELRRTGKALMSILNCGGRYVDGQGFKCPEFLAFEKALATTEGE